MSEVILAVLNRPEAVPNLLRAAGRLASLVGGAARINALAMHQPVRVNALVAEGLVIGADTALALGLEDKERMATLKTAFERWGAEAGEAAANARWIEVEGSAANVVTERGSRADVVVAEPPLKGDTLARQVVRAALFGTDRPVLIVPPSATSTAPFGRCVAIAWRDDKQAARAVVPALRWLAASAGQVHVLMGLRDEAALPRMPRIFVEHGVRAQLHVLPLLRFGQPFGELLMDKAHAIGADTLVMGAYAHSPLRELILGGVTRYMLTHADLPVLMRH